MEAWRRSGRTGDIVPMWKPAGCRRLGSTVYNTGCKLTHCRLPTMKRN